MDRLLHWITGYLPCRLITDNGRPYLERYFVGKAFGWTVYLHRFVDSDPDRGLHNHPWSRALSFVLVGGYWEQTRAGFRRIRWFNALSFDTFHRVVLQRNDDGTAQCCWTLFMHRKYVAGWGFIRPFRAFGGDAGQLYREHVPASDEKTGKEQWWTTAPSGRHAARVPF